MDARTGKTLWKTDRPEFRRSLPRRLSGINDGEEELVVPGSIWLKSYNLKDGSERWTYAAHREWPAVHRLPATACLFSASWNIGWRRGRADQNAAFRRSRARLRQKQRRKIYRR